MDLSKLLESIQDDESFTTVTEKLKYKSRKLEIGLNSSTINALAKIKSLEIKYFRTHHAKGAAILAYKLLLELPPSRFMEKPLDRVLAYWLQSVINHLIGLDVQWWSFVKTILILIRLQHVRCKVYKSSLDTLVQECTAGLLEIATHEATHAVQAHQILSTLNLCLIECSQTVRYDLAEPLKQLLLKLSPIMAMCGHYPLQSSALMCYHMFYNRNDKLDTVFDWLPVTKFNPDVISIFTREFNTEQDSRDFLNALNASSDRVMSVKFDKLTPEIPNAKNYWVDLNACTSCLSINFYDNIDCVTQWNTIAVTTDNAIIVTLARVQSQQIAIRITTKEPAQIVLPSATVFTANTLEIQLLQGCDLSKVNKGLRIVFGDKYQLPEKLQLIPQAFDRKMSPIQRAPEFSSVLEDINEEICDSYNKTTQKSQAQNHVNTKKSLQSTTSDESNTSAISNTLVTYSNVRKRSFRDLKLEQVVQSTESDSHRTTDIPAKKNKPTKFAPRFRRKRKYWAKTQLCPKDNKIHEDVDSDSSNHQPLKKARKCVNKPKKPVWKKQFGNQPNKNANLSKSLTRKPEILSPKTKKMNTVFDRLKSNIEGAEEIKYIDKKLDKDLAVFDFTSDREDEEFTKKKIELQTKISNSKLYSHKEDVSSDSSSEQPLTSIRENLQNKATQNKDQTKRHCPKTPSCACYEDKDRIKLGIRTRRLSKPLTRKPEILSPKTNKMNAVFDRLKSNIEGAEEVKYIDKKLDKDLALFNFTSDSEDEELTKKKIELQKKISNSTLASKSSRTIRRGKLPKEDKNEEKTTAKKGRNISNNPRARPDTKSVTKKTAKGKGPAKRQIDVPQDDSGGSVSPLPELVVETLESNPHPRRYDTDDSGLSTRLMQKLTQICNNQNADNVKHTTQNLLRDDDENSLIIENFNELGNENDVDDANPEKVDEETGAHSTFSVTKKKSLTLKKVMPHKHDQIKHSVAIVSKQSPRQSEFDQILCLDEEAIRSQLKETDFDLQHNDSASNKNITVRNKNKPIDNENSKKGGKIKILSNIEIISTKTITSPRYCDSGNESSSNHTNTNELGVVGHVNSILKNIATSFDENHNISERESGTSLLSSGQTRQSLEPTKPKNKDLLGRSETIPVSRRIPEKRPDTQEGAPLKPILYKKVAPEIDTRAHTFIRRPDTNLRTKTSNDPVSPSLRTDFDIEGWLENCEQVANLDGSAMQQWRRNTSW